MPVNKKLARALIKHYGYDKGKEIYMSMEKDNKPAFRKGMKTAKKKGETQKSFPRRPKKKERR